MEPAEAAEAGQAPPADAAGSPSGEDVDAETLAAIAALEEADAAKQAELMLEVEAAVDADAGAPPEAAPESAPDAAEGEGEAAAAAPAAEGEEVPAEDPAAASGPVAEAQPAEAQPADPPEAPAASTPERSPEAEAPPVSPSAASPSAASPSAASPLPTSPFAGSQPPASPLRAAAASRAGTAAGAGAPWPQEPSWAAPPRHETSGHGTAQQELSRQVTAKVDPAADDLYRGTMDMAGLIPRVKLGSFETKWPDGRRTPAEIAFWPRGKPVSLTKLFRIIEKDWRLPRPNLVILIDAGTAHPGMLSNPMLRNLPKFKAWLEHARVQHELLDLRSGHGYAGARPKGSDRDRRQRNEWENHAPAEAGDPAEAAILDRVVFEKLVGVITAVLDAAERTNNYIIIDRSAGSSHTAELLVEFALRQTEAKPIVMVIDSRERLLSYTGEASTRQLEQLAEIEARSIPLGSDDVRRRVEVSPLYSPDDFRDPERFGGRKILGLPLPKEPEPQHLMKNGVDVQVGDCGPVWAMNPRRLWCYHYGQHLFGSGTHYILVEESQQRFPLETLGPVGGIFAHGGNIAYNRMQSWLQLGRPTVMLFNTGGVTQAFASLHDAVVRRHEQDVNGILRGLQIVSAEAWATNFGVADIVRMKELYKRAPSVFRKAVVSVDVLSDSAEDVVQVVSGCFANGASQLPELGLRSAENDVVLSAWSQHLMLFSSAASYKRLSDLYFFLAVTLLFLTAVISVLMVELPRLLDEPMVYEGKMTLRVGIVVVPILSGVIGTVMQRKRAIQKWSLLTTSSMRIVAEIYKFRARVLEYDLPACAQGFEGLDALDSDLANAGRGRLARQARSRFVKAIQVIFGRVLDGDMSKDSLSMRGLAASINRPSGEPAVTPEALLVHVQERLLRADRASCCCCCRRRSARVHPAPEGDRMGDGRSGDEQLQLGSASSFLGQDVFFDVEEDDYTSALSIETYVHKRVRPLLLHFSRKAGRLHWRMSILEYSMILLDSSIVVLGVLEGLHPWVGFAVAVRVLLMNTLQYLAYAPQLGALNHGIGELQNLLTWWDSLSVIDRRTRAAKHRIVCTAEQAMLGDAASRASETPVNVIDIATMMLGSHNGLSDAQTGGDDDMEETGMRRRRGDTGRANGWERSGRFSP